MSSVILRLLLPTLLCACGPDAYANSETDAYRIEDVFSVGETTYVRSLLVDEHSLWIGTSVGVLEIDLRSQEVLNTFTREHGLANEYVFAIGRDRTGHLWFGTNAGGTSRYRDGEWEVFFPMHGLADYWVYAFAQQPDGDFWIGTWAGANRVDLDTLTFTTYVSELVNEWVYGLTVDARDRVWFGTEGGVSMLDGDRWQHWTHADGLGAANVAGLPHSTNTGLGTRSRHDLSVRVDGQGSYNPSYVLSVHADASGNIWAGTWGGGAAKFDGQRWSNRTVADGLAGNIVYSVVEDRHGGLWFGTDGGISHYSANGRWQSFTPDEGLPGSDVYALAIDERDNVWAGQRGAVIRLGPASPAPAADDTASTASGATGTAGSDSSDTRESRN